MLRKLGIWIIASILSFCLITFIFITAIHVDVDSIIKDIYKHSDDKAKQKIKSLITNLCVSVNDNELQLEKARAVYAQSDEQTQQVVSLCREFKQKQIADEELFSKAVHLYLGELSSMQFQQDLENKLSDNAGDGALQLRKIYSYYKMLRRIVLPFLTFLILFLFVILYLFYLKNPLDYMRRSGAIFFRVGLTFLIPFLLLQAYLLINPLDTTPIVNNLLSSIDQTDATITPQTHIEPVVLLVLKIIYSTRIFVISLITLLIGILLRWILPKFLQKKVTKAEL